MTRKYHAFVRLTAICLVVCLCLSLAACTQPGGNDVTDPTDATGGAGAKNTYTILVKTDAGQPVVELGVYIYTDSTLAELVWFAKTDAEGKVTFDDTTCEGYVAVLADVPDGYVVEENYPITGETTEIILAGDGSMGDLSKITYKLGDQMRDFLVTTADGTEYTLSQLLEEKDAIVLNFWYLECNPCKLEFPYLQEAYENYSEKLEVLAINPVNTDADAVAAFQAENGLTFPMMVGDPNWEKAMQLTAYPTTVVIDRTGTISLIHAGSIDSAETFERIFSYFTAEDYEPGVIESIDELPELVKPGSSADNPIETGSVTSISITLEPGEKLYYHLYRVNNMYLQINNANAFVEYGGNTYNPSNGYIGFMLSTPDTYTPAAVVFGNSGTETVTYTVTLSAAYGSFNNPIGLSLGEFTTDIYAGNDQGVYYRWTATESGVFTVQFLSGTDGVVCDYILSNTSSMAVRSLRSEGDLTTGTVSVDVKAGQTVQVNVSTMPDSTNAYPGGSFIALASFVAGGSDDEEELEKLTYTITVTDAAGTALTNVNIAVDVDGTANHIATNASGVATIELPKGTYTATLIVPDGYTAETTTYTLTEEAPSVAVQLQTVQIVMVDYTVTVQDPNNEPLSGVMVVIGSKVAYTDDSGKAVFNLEKGIYTAVVVAPDGLEADSAGYAFPEDAAELTAVLDWKPGTSNAPIAITTLPYVTDVLLADAEIYYNLFYTGTPILTVSEPDAYVIYNGTTYGVDNSGIVTVQLLSGHPMMPATIVVGNGSGSKTGYTINLVYPEGTMSNPKVLTDISEFTTELAEGNSEGYFYTWTADQTGSLVFEVTGVTEGVAYDIIVTNQNTSVQKNIDADGIQAENGNMTVTVPVTQGDELSVIVTALPDADWSYPAAVITVKGAVVTTGEPDPSEPESSTPESSEPESSEPESSEPDPSTPDPSVPDVSTEITYTVTVVDSEGSPVSNVTVMLNTTIFAGVTDETGKISYETTSGTYTVTLAGTNAYYNKSAALLTANVPDLVIKLAAEVDPDKTMALYNINPNGGEDNVAYILPVGTTHVELGTGKSYYNADSNSCFFVFVPEEAGTYRVTVDNAGADIAAWGTPFNIFLQEKASANEDNSLQYSVQEGQAGNMDYVLGIEVVDGITDVAVTITRIGDAGFDISAVDFDTAWRSDYVPTAFTLTLADGETLTYVDIVNGKAEDYVLVLSETDHFYHLGTADGPVVYLNLGYDAPYVSLQKMIRGDASGFGGAPLRKYFYDENGVFLKKEDYTDCVNTYINCMDASTGLYPLTKDLAYALQNGGESWWDPASPSCIIEGANPDIAWLFACCYAE